VSKNHYKYLQRAGFIVLRAPDVPSILVEVGFVSNPEEEQLLNDTVHQLRIAQAVAVGVRNYFVENAPFDSLIARR
jgi:N-acetylmuramoyl-L-alanine amidase